MKKGDLSWLRQNVQKRFELSVSFAEKSKRFNETSHRDAVMAPQFLTDFPGKPIHFHGRDDSLVTLCAAFQLDSSIVVLHGIGGIGKTTLAEEYVCRYMAGYYHILWLPFSHGLRSTLVNSEQLITALNLQLCDTKSLYDEILQSLQQLSNRSAPCLLVLDDLDQVLSQAECKTLLQLSGWHILITSQFKIEGFRNVELPTLPVSEAAKLYRQFRPQEDTALVRTLVEAVGCHSLAVEVLARTAAFSAKTPEQFIGLFLEKVRIRVPILHGKPPTLAHILKYFDILFDESQLSERQKAVLNCFIALPSGYMSLEILCDILRDQLAVADEELSMLLNQLSAMGWLQKHVVPEGWKLHPVLLSVLIRRFGADSDAFWATMKSLIHTLQSKFSDNLMQSTPLVCKNWLPFGETLVSHVLDKPCIYSQIGYLLSDLGSLFYFFGQYDKAIMYLENALIIVKENQDRTAEVLCYATLGSACQAMGKFGKAIAYHKKRLAIAHVSGDRLIISQCCGNLGDIYMLLDDYTNAISYYKNQVEIAKEISDRYGEAYAYGNLGNACLSLGKFEDAITFQERFFAIAQAIGDRRGEGQACSNLGIAHALIGKYDNAIECHETALEIAKSIKDRQAEANAYGNLGNVFFALCEFDKSIMYQANALATFKEIKDRQGEGKALGNLGAAHYSLGEISKAIDYHKKRLVLAHALQDRRGAATAYCNLGIVYAVQGHQPTALEYFNKSHQLFTEILPPGHPNLVILARARRECLAKIKKK